MTTPDPTPEARAREIVTQWYRENTDENVAPTGLRRSAIHDLVLVVDSALKAARLEGMEAERVKLAGILDARALTLRTPGARTATAVAASIVRRGRELTATEKLENFAAYADEGGDADLAAAIRQAMEGA